MIESLQLHKTGEKSLTYQVRRKKSVTCIIVRSFVRMQKCFHSHFSLFKSTIAAANEKMSIELTMRKCVLVKIWRYSSLARNVSSVLHRCAEVNRKRWKQNKSNFRWIIMILQQCTLERSGIDCLLHFHFQISVIWKFSFHYSLLGVQSNALVEKTCPINWIWYISLYWRKVKENLIFLPLIYLLTLIGVNLLSRFHNHSDYMQSQLMPIVQFNHSKAKITQRWSGTLEQISFTIMLGKTSWLYFPIIFRLR